MSILRHLTVVSLVLLPWFQAGGGSASVGPVKSQAVPTPRLVVLVSLDQMRADYVARYSHQWTGGLKRLLTGGASFVSAAYPYLNTVTCPGHATISTGTFPRTHGLILNSWWDRELGRSVDCLADSTVVALPYNVPGARSGGFGPRDLRAPTYGDELRGHTSGASRVFSAAVKARSAIALAGARGDLVVWVDQGGLTTSTAFTPARSPFVEDFVRRHSLDAELGRDWTRLLPADQYLQADADAAERPPAGWTHVFPHAIGTGADAGRRAGLWSASPLVDEYLGRLMEEAVAREGLGTREVPDLLAISFSSLDSVGHAFGPDSHEVQDALIRIDRVLGRLFDTIDREVGAGRYVVALSADHGVAPIPERAARTGLDAGRVDLAAASAAVESALGRRFGPGKYVSRAVYTDLYLAPGVLARVQSDPEAWADVSTALRGVRGVDRVIRADEVTSPFATDDPALRAARLSYFPGRSGDIIIVPRPYWILSTAATTHGSLHGYDTRVPLVLYGAGIRPGTYRDQASPADIAPTLAALTGVTMSRAEGRVLIEALAAGDQRTPAIAR